MKRILYIVFLLGVFSDAGMSQAPKWKVELDEPVQLYEFLQNGKYLFFNSGEFAWLFESSTGKEVYKIEVEDYEKMGVHTLIGDRYIVSSDGALNCYNAVTGKKEWGKEYNDIDQDEFKSYEFIGTTAVFRFGSTEIAIDLSNGNEIWRAEIRYNGDLAEFGTFNYMVLSQQKKMLVLEKGDRAALFDITNGKKVMEIEEVEINEDLMKAKHPWLWHSDDQKFVVLALESGVAVIDVANNKLQVKKEFNIEGDDNIFFETKSGCAVFGEKKIVSFNFSSGGILEVPYPIDDMRTLESFVVGEKNILMISSKNRMTGIDLGAGKILWETPADDPKFEGFAHRYLKQDGNNILFTYVKTGSFSVTSGGTWVYLMNLDAITGKLNYQKLVGISKTAITDIARAAGKIAGAIVSTLRSDNAGDQISKSFGYENIGFNYTVTERDGNMLFFFMNTTAMANPDTKEEPGEGVVLIDPSNGSIVYKEHFEIMYNSSWGAAGRGVAAFTPAPLFEGNIVYLCGNARVVAFDLVAGKRLWTVAKDFDEGYPTDIAVIDGGVYVKFGKDPVTPTLNQTNVNVASPWESDPHGFMAVDAADGKVLWKLNLESDPGILLPQFTIKNYYNPAAKQLYFADEENVYALQLKRNGGKYDWTVHLDDAGVGEIPSDKMYAVSERWLGTVPRTTTSTHSLGGGSTLTTSGTSGGMSDEQVSKFLEDAEDAETATTYTSWGNIWGVTAKRCLRVSFDEKHLLVLATEGIAMIGVASGKPVWVTEWDYDNTNVQWVPRVMNGKIVYCLDREMTALELSNGKQIWKAPEAKKPKFFVSPDGKFVFSIDNEVVAGYGL